MSGTIEGERAAYGTFHAGQNRINSIKDGIITMTMDKEADGGLPREAICQKGDSGSAVLLKTGSGDFDYQIVGVCSNVDPVGQYGAFAAYAYVGGLSNDWVLNNIKFDDDGNPLPKYDVDNCDAFNDPDGDGTFWAQEMVSVDVDGDGKVSTEEWSNMYGAVKDICVCETEEAMFKRFDADGDDYMSVDEFKGIWEYFKGWSCETVAMTFWDNPDDPKKDICEFYGIPYNLEGDSAMKLLQGSLALTLLALGMM